MYHSNYIINGIDADKLMALQLERALSGVKKQVFEQAKRIGDGTTRLLYYASCLTDNYQDVCAKLKEEDWRFIKGLEQLVLKRDIIYRMLYLYFEEVFRFYTPHQLEAIKSGLLRAGVVISASALNTQAFSIGITTAVCLGISFNASIVKWTGRVSTISVIGFGLYGIVQQAAESAERLKLMSPVYYHALYLQKIEMMYFLIESIFIKSSAFESDVINTIINMVK